MEFLDAAGLAPKRNGWNRERIIAAFVRFYREHGRMPITTDFKRAMPGYPGCKAVYQHLGGWGPAAQAAWARVAELQRIGNSNTAA